MVAPGVYLDYNATAPVRPAAVRAVGRALETVGNPSSVHGFGRAARRLVEDARETVAAMVAAPPSGVIFTSGGTEANALALAGWRRRRVLASAVEHPSVLKSGVTATIPVDRNGLVDLGALDALLAADDTPALVAVMLGNNETGVLQPLADVAAIAHARGALVHCDAVQAAGKIPVDLTRLGADSLSLSAHKLGGPQGVGALVLANGEAEIAPLIPGGGQERRRRSGTENLPGISGFAAAAEEARDDLDGYGLLGKLRDRMEEAIRAIAPGVTVFGAEGARLPNTSCLAVPGLSAQTALMALDLAGIAVSSGSACSSGKVGPSHVLSAMGYGALASAAIRVSLGWASTEGDIDRFVSALGDLVRRVVGGAAASAA